MRLGLSRHRLYVFRRCRAGVNQKAKLLLWMAIIFSLTLLAATCFESCVRPNLIIAARSQTALYANKTINNAVSEVLSSYGTSGDFGSLERDDTGSIRAYRINTAAVNRFSSDLSQRIYDAIDDVEESQVVIPLGNILWKHSLFTQMGPKIRVHIKPVGLSDIQLTSHFTEAGINEVRHEVLLTVKLTMIAYIPGATTKVSVTSSIPVDQTVLMGDIPDNYTNFEGSTSEAEDRILDISQKK